MNGRIRGKTSFSQITLIGIRLISIAICLMLAGCSPNATVDAPQRGELREAEPAEVKSEANEPTGVVIDKEGLELKPGETAELKYAAIPEGTEGKFAWKSLDKSVASVDEDGRVSAIAAGETQLMVFAENGVNALCKITVKASPLEALNEHERMIYDGIIENIDRFREPESVGLDAVGYSNIEGLSEGDKYFFQLRLRGENVFGGMAGKDYGLLCSGGKYVLVPAKEVKKNAFTPAKKEKIDPDKINAALLAYWEEK